MYFDLANYQTMALVDRTASAHLLSVGAPLAISGHSYSAHMADPLDSQEPQNL
jgi:hypothetical protein